MIDQFGRFRSDHPYDKFRTVEESANGIMFDNDHVLLAPYRCIEGDMDTPRTRKVLIELDLLLGEEEVGVGYGELYALMPVPPCT